MQPSDEFDLIERANGGDHQAFRKLVEAHQRFVFSVAHRFTGNSDEAEDITQEVFIKVWRNLRKYQREIKLTTWMYKITTNQCLDYLKSANRKRQLNKVNVELSHQIPDVTSGESNADDRELIGVITALAKQLTPMQQTVFILRDLEGLPAEEVCEVSGMSASNMKSNLYYARVKIRESLTQYYKERTKLPVS